MSDQAETARMMREITRSRDILQTLADDTKGSSGRGSMRGAMSTAASESSHALGLREVDEGFQATVDVPVNGSVGRCRMFIIVNR
jgi:hypothetical protein